jgi:hypothetical protein
MGNMGVEAEKEQTTKYTKGTKGKTTVELFSERCSGRPIVYR